MTVRGGHGSESGSGFSLQRGIIEGFYGTPWTQSARLGLIEFAARVGFNHFCYGPKHDPYVRDHWRQVALDDAGGRQLLEWVACAHAAGMSTGFAVGPGLDVAFSEDGDHHALRAKVAYLLDHGIDEIVLLFDDIDPSLRPRDVGRFRSYAEAQADMANRLLDDIRVRFGTVPMTFCPTEYWGLDDTWYKATLARVLDPAWRVIWTGPDICSETIARGDVDGARDLFRHPLVIWDNYPVNDEGMVHEMHLGPLEGRDPGFLSAINGYLANPMAAAEASKVGLFTIGRFLNEAERYDPFASWPEALALWGDALRPLLTDVGWATRRSCCGRGSDLEALVDALKGDDTLPDAVREALVPWLSQEGQDIPQPLATELKPWLDKARLLARWVLLEVAGASDPDVEPQVYNNPKVLWNGALEAWMERRRSHLGRGRRPPVSD